MTDRFVIEFPWRIELANTYLRMHWAAKRKYTDRIVAEISAAIPAWQRPATPWDRWSIIIERESSREPDHGAIGFGAKPILDALQPASKRHPYGLGIVVDDSPAYLVGADYVHVQGQGKRTKITVVKS